MKPKKNLFFFEKLIFLILIFNCQIDVEPPAYVRTVVCSCMLLYSVVFCCVLLCAVVCCCIMLCAVVCCCVLLCAVVFSIDKWLKIRWSLTSW